MTKKLKPRFQNADVLRMFPTFVWKAELRPELHTPINDLILGKLGEIGAPLAGLKTGESWQSDQRLHELDQFQELMGCIDEAAEIVLDYLKVGHEGFTITGCWTNVSAPAADHRAHSHPNNYLSGVYYVRTAEGANTINFHDPRPQTAIIRPPVTELTALNTDQVVVKVRDGTLLMFPAWLRHSVDPNRGERARVSIGFNIMLSSYVETISRPGWEGGRRRSV